ncbi:MAG: DNA repair and recombination protein RadB [Nanoarchaeota archaeon]|nr:DNA repair and recombination protein RadB [Nanoarchaeota archaeon]
MALKLNNFFYDIVGDLQEDTITTIYGPPGVGKSTICFQYIISCLNNSKKVIYIDTEGGFSVERLKQMDETINLENIIVLKPKTFEDQNKLIKNLNSQIKSSNQVGLVIVDSLVMLYRLKLGDAPQKINSDLGEQLRLLTEISRCFHIPILVTNQMYYEFDTKKPKMVGGTLIEYWSKTIIELENENDFKKVTLIKHKFKKEGFEKIFEIKNLGIKEIKSKGFSLFK